MTRKFSPLFDPLMLQSDMVGGATVGGEVGTALVKKIKKIDWINVSINFILPVAILLFVAFMLKSKYDRKKELYNEYFIN